MEFIHRDIARYLVFLVIIRVLVCVTLRDLKPIEWSHRSPEHRARDGVTVRRQQRPRDAGNTLPHSRQMAAGHACRPGSADVTTQPPELRAVGASGHAANMAGRAGLPGSRSAGRRSHRGRRSVHRQRGSRGGAWRPADRRSGVLLAGLNIQSLKPKLLELRQELARNRYDLLVLTKTWMRPSTPSRLISIPGYDIYRRDRPDQSGYGGVAIVIKEPCNFCEIPQPKVSENSKLESLWAVVGTGGGRRRFILAAVYRPPRRTVAALEADFGELERQYQAAVLRHPGLPVIMPCSDTPACLS